jgi:hypothetical protein
VILGRLSREGMPLVGARFTVSIGIAVSDGDETDFAQMHRNADPCTRREPKAEIASACSSRWVKRSRSRPRLRK